jgi:hypothetical protein
MHARAILFAVLVSSAGGCYASGGYGYGTTGYVTTPSVNAQVEVAPVQASVDLGATAAVDVSGPELVSVAPDVQVIVDHEEPIFFSDGHYWRETNGAWYRSTIHTGGWSYYAAAPYAVRSLDRRDSYRRYRPQGYVSRGSRGYDRGYDRGHTVRDHRGGYDRGYTRSTNRGYDNRGGYVRDSGPAVRDHRTGYDRGGYTRGTNRGYDNRGGYVRNGGATVRDHRGSYDRGGYQRGGYQRAGNGGYQRQTTVRDNRRPTTVRDNRSYNRSGRDNRGSYRRR